MAVLYRPITNRLKDTYEIEDYRGDNSYEDVMKHLPLSIALGASLFFWNLESALLRVSLASLESQTKEIENQTTQSQLSSQKSGVGITPYIDLLKATLTDWKLSQPYPLERLSLSYRMKSKKTKSKPILTKDI